ncbi:MAG: thiamine pyrophosphate-binding protein, partial [Kineosporiaceae bacterium]
MVTESRPAKQAFVEQLVADGLTTVVGNPGTVEQGLLDVLEQTPGMRYVLTLQEAAAVGIADGIARGSNGAAVLQLHSGVGLGNSIGMLYQSMRGHSPLVCFAGEAGLAYANLDAQMAVDLVAMARPVTKWAERVTHPDSVVRMLRRAVKVALTPPRGPVFLALPADVLDATTDVPVLPTVIPDSRSAPHPDVVAAAAERLGRATTPVVLVGDGVDLASAHHHLVAVAEVLGADVWSVDSSVPNIPASHPLSRGQLGHMFGTVSEASIGGADAVLVVGTYVFPEVFPSLRSPFAPDASIVHIDLDAWEIAKNHPVDVAMLADPANALRDLSRHLGETMSQEARRAAGGRL